MKDDGRTSDDHVSIDEERITVAKQVDLANNVQARYATSKASGALRRILLSNEHEHEGSRILFEISLGLSC